MIRIGNSGVVSSASMRDLEDLRAQFQRQHYIRLPQLLDPALLNFIQLRIDRAEFYERVHQGIGSNKELCMKGNAAFGALLFAINDERLFRIIQDITQCDRIRCFEGRVYRVGPGLGHHDSWHDDLGEHRLVGLSVNLGPEAYAGGALQIRERASGNIVSEVAKPGTGDAVIFRLSDSLQHRITQVEGTIFKTAFAGWFRSQPDFLSLLKERSDSNRGAQLLQPSRFVSEPKDRSAPNIAY